MTQVIIYILISLASFTDVTADTSDTRRPIDTTPDRTIIIEDLDFGG